MGTVDLTTKRLVLRRYKETDASQLFLHFGTNAKMYEFSGWNPYATEEMAVETVSRFIKSYSDDHFYGWAIEHDHELIGTAGAYDYDPASNSIEIGISIREDCWRHGFATETLICVLDHLTNNEAIRIVTAWCASDNTGSVRAIQKARMIQTDVINDGLEINGKMYDKLVFSFTA